MAAKRRNSKEVIVHKSGGYIFYAESKDSIAHRAKWGDRSVELGQFVTTTDKVPAYMANEGVRGVIVGIGYPYQEGRSSNIFDVWLEGAHSARQMKIGEFK
jgi:hypothetical protein